MEEGCWWERQGSALIARGGDLVVMEAVVPTRLLGVQHHELRGLLELFDADSSLKPAPFHGIFVTQEDPGRHFGPTHRALLAHSVAHLAHPL